MNIAKLFAVSAALVVSTGAFAQGLTRDEVRAQLVQAEQSGSRLVTDASYPDVSPIYQNQTAHSKTQDSDAYGGMKTASGAGSAPMNMSDCVGPYSFCHIYAGS
ncbi:DUF4148 domain-containing protein [Caballeronia sp. LZ062]|uniref:DUF4148 domain-containing protein n=1 Tax=unclassified Caballeronia TaxID=2646786 RepID=UPI002858A6E6|nr:MULTISPECIES: DUF4148 domain-containing protein [unclassified Caballeronia]MDR5857423.1 DUF4148 domain-containing protein [Caballeronia sp. LZ050]MDR5868974.1 DUF4148 domain-containing protein [Caballeronia sp. LZ062]